MAEAAQKEKEAAGEATRAAEDAASASAEAETAAKDATDADAAVAAAEDSAAALADGIKNSPPIGYSYVDGSDNHHCAESSRIDLDCGGCGPHWGDVKACAAKCDADVTCHFFTYFHDDGCRIYTKCDSQEQPDWLPGVGSTIFQRTPTYFMAPQYVENSGGDWDEAVCPEGSVAIGGGCNARASPFIMEKASVSKSLKKYKCGGSGAPKDVYAICAFDDGKFERVESKGGDWHVVDCPAGTVVVSGGCRAYKSPHKFEYNGPFGNGWKCGGHGGKKKVWAVCHKQ